MQTCSDFELILIDDGSNDMTLSICQMYEKKDTRVKVLHKENGGHTSARNEGLQRACGKYILFLDSDDWLECGTLTCCQQEIISKSPDIIIFDMKNTLKQVSFPIMLEDGFYEGEKIETLIKNNLIMNKDGETVFTKSLSAKCFKKDIVYESQMLVPKDVLIGEDGIALVGSVLNAGKISIITKNQQACYYCFVREDSVSHSPIQDEFRRTNILLRHYEDVLLYGKKGYSEQFCRYIVAQLYTASLFVLRSGENKKALNEGLDYILKNPTFANALKKAKFSVKGYKYIIKKFILRHRLWAFSKLIDRR